MITSDKGSGPVNPTWATEAFGLMQCLLPPLKCGSNDSPGVIPAGWENRNPSFGPAPCFGLGDVVQSACVP